MADNAGIVLKINGLDISFRSTRGSIHAIRGVDLLLRKGETLALVGESGSGKSVTMRAVMGILPSNAVVNSGEILFSYSDGDGAEQTEDLLKMSREWREKNINGSRISPESFQRKNRSSCTRVSR